MRQRGAMRRRESKREGSGRTNHERTTKTVEKHGQIMLKLYFSRAPKSEKKRAGKGDRKCQFDGVEPVPTHLENGVHGDNDDFDESNDVERSIDRFTYQLFGLEIT